MTPRLSVAADAFELGARLGEFNPRPVLNPCVLLGLGPTATAAVKAAQERIRAQLQGEPPFHAVLTMERLEPVPVCGLQVGGKTLQPGDASEVAPAAHWLEFALSRVTETWRNLEYNVWRGSRNAFERVELIVVAALDEVDTLAAQLQMIRDVSTRFPGCWRLGVFWLFPLSSGTSEQRGGWSSTIEDRLAALERQQVGADEQDPNPLFDASFLLGTPATPGLHTLRSTDVIELTAAFLGYALASNFAQPLRQFLQAHGGPWQYHFGLLARHYRTDETLEALNRLWLGEALAILEAPLPEPVKSATDTSALSVTSCRSGTMDQAEAEITGYLEAIRAEASRWPPGPLKTPASNGDPPPRTNGQYRMRRYDSLLPRADAIFREHIETILKLGSLWQRERDELHHRHEQWKLTPGPGSSVQTQIKTKGVGYRWSYLLFLLPSLPLLWIAWISGTPMNMALTVALTAVGLALVVGRMVRKSSQLTPRSVRHRGSEQSIEEGQELERQLQLTTAMVVDPETRAETLSEGTSAQPHGLWHAACELGEWHRQLARFRHALRQAALAGEDADSWFVRNIISRRNLDLVFSRALAAAYEERAAANGENPISAAGGRHEVMSMLLNEVLEPHGLGFGLEHGPERILEAVVQIGRKLVAHCEHLTLAELLASLGHDHPSGLDGPSVFFNTLARGAVVLWNRAPDQTSGELTQLLHSDPWDPELAQRGAEIIGHCETSRENFRGEIALIRVIRGKRWPSMGGPR